MRQYQYRVTADPETGAIIERLADLTGKSPAKIIREWLKEASGALGIVAETIEVAKQVEAEAKGAYSAAIERSSAKIEDLETDLIAVMGAIRDGANSAISERAAPPPASVSVLGERASSPRPVIRGPQTQRTGVKNDL